VDASVQFAAWLQKNHPAPFNQLLKASLAAKRLGDLDDLDFDTSDIEVPDVEVPDISLDLDLPPLSGTDFFSLGNSGAPTSTEISQLTAGASAPVAVSAPTMPPPTANTGNTSALQSVGNFIASPGGGQVIQAITSGANQIVTSQAAAATIAAQAARAAAGLAPANVTYTTYTDPNTGQVTAVPVLNGSQGSLPLNASGISALIPASFLQSSGLWIIVGLAALYFLME
jgi:hypothetical protein